MKTLLWDKKQLKIKFKTLLDKIWMGIAAWNYVGGGVFNNFLALRSSEHLRYLAYHLLSTIFY